MLALLEANITPIFVSLLKDAAIQPYMLFNWSLSSLGTSSEVSSQNSNAKTKIIIASQSLLHIQSCSSGFLELSDLEPAKCWRTVSFWYAPLCSYRRDSLMQKRCFYQSLVHQIQPLLVSSPSSSTWSIRNGLTLSMKHSLVSVFVESQTMSTSTHKFYLPWREREARRPLANVSAWSRSVAFKEASVSSAIIIVFKRSLKRFSGLNTEFVLTGSTSTWICTQSSDMIRAYMTRITSSRS